MNPFVCSANQHITDLPCAPSPGCRCLTLAARKVIFIMCMCRWDAQRIQVVSNGMTRFMFFNGHIIDPAHHLGLRARETRDWLFRNDKAAIFPSSYGKVAALSFLKSQSLVS